MPKLEIQLSEKEITDLIDGKKISLGEQKEYSNVYLIKEKSKNDNTQDEINDYSLLLNKQGIRFENSKGESFNIYDSLKAIKNAKKGDTVLNEYGYFKYDGLTWNKMIFGDIND